MNWYGLVDQKGDQFTYFLSKAFFFKLEKKNHMIYTYLMNLFHQEFTLDYDCFCGYIYNSTSIDICHICAS